jgi:outer membrane receptor for ferric coprogen and ferric-rhodotorulic acid
MRQHYTQCRPRQYKSETKKKYNVRPIETQASINSRIRELPRTVCVVILAREQQIRKQS